MFSLLLYNFIQFVQLETFWLKCFSSTWALCTNISWSYCFIAMAKKAAAKQKPAMKSVESVKKVVKKANTLKKGMKYQPSSGSKVGSSSSSSIAVLNKNIAKGDLVGPPPLTLQ